MKTVSLSALLATSLLAFACGSDDDGAAERPGFENPQMGQGGGGQMPMGQAGGAAMPGGEDVGDAPAMGMVDPAPMAPTFNYGPALTITDDTVVEATTGISGNVFWVANMGVEGNEPPASEIAVQAATDDKICWSGSIYQVPDATAYGTHWGVQVGINLNVPAVEEGEGAPAGWDAGNVVGFAFKVTGTDLPETFRMLGMPETLAEPNDLAGADPNFCATIPVVADAETEILFTDIVDRCWGEAPRVEFAPPLLNVAWQIASDVSPIHNYAFDFCIEDIRPILGE